MANTSASLPSIYELIEIIKDEKVIRLDGKTTTFDYYESLLSPNITATMSFVDTGSSLKYSSEYDSQERIGGVYNALPLMGDGTEKVRFKISNSLGTLDFSNTPLYVNGAVNPNQESQRESIILSLISKTAITNQETHVKKNYSKFAKISQSVKSITKDILKIPDNRIDIEETSNKYPFIGNMKSPFDIIMILASKSVPLIGNPGFFFYETKERYYFKSIDELISKEPINKDFPYFYSGANISSINAPTNYKILSFRVDKNQNLINALKSGVYSSRHVIFNPRTFKEEEYTLTIDMKKTLGKKNISKLENTQYSRILYSIKDVGALSPEVSEKNTSGEPKDWQGLSQMRYNFLFTQVVKIQVPCNPGLNAGDVILCNFETITIGDKAQGSDPVQSGKYLILDLCHHYDTKRSFTSMTLVRDTYGLYTNKN